MVAAAIPNELADHALFEHWAKEFRWPALEAGLPLVLGVQPGAWPRLIAGVPAAASLQQLLAQALELRPGEDALMVPAQLRAAAERLGLVLPSHLAQLLDFLARVLPVQEASAADAEADSLAAQERETLLGIALLLVTRMPRECLDEEGYFNVERIADLILQRSARWFPLAPPALDRAGLCRLLATWITPGV